MPNPSITQVIEFREQIALADDAGGANRDRMWALELFGDVVAISVGRGLIWMQTRFGLQENLPIIDASNVDFLSCNYWDRARWPVRCASSPARTMPVSV